MHNPLKIGTRESQLAIWQSTLVKGMLSRYGTDSELIYIQSDGDMDLKTPLYEMGVQGIFTKTLDLALLSGKIDVAVHSMKDVPTQLAFGLEQAAVLKRGNYKDILVFREGLYRSGIGSGVPVNDFLSSSLIIATSSIRRKAQWLHRYPNHTIRNLRGNINTRIKKLAESDWHGAIFAAAGLERINLRGENTVDLAWMLPAPAQGAIVMVCREEDNDTKEKCMPLNDATTAICTKIERDFLKTLLGGCSTPISALAEIEENELFFRGNILSLDGKQKLETEKILPLDKADAIGIEAAKELLQNGGQAIADNIRHASR
jgi:hydroxymethylbilane synthase